eukprot:scaffold262674_cov20-Attheya_sp.AAC.1
MASDDPAAVQARMDELEVELRSIVLQLAQGLVQQNNVAPRLLRCEFRGWSRVSLLGGRDSFGNHHPKSWVSNTRCGSLWPSNH